MRIYIYYKQKIQNTFLIFQTMSVHKIEGFFFFLVEFFRLSFVFYGKRREKEGLIRFR